MENDKSRNKAQEEKITCGITRFSRADMETCNVIRNVTRNIMKYVTRLRNIDEGNVNRQILL